VPLFHKFGVEEQITQIASPRVEMPSGGFLVIDQTEALVAIDVNSGKFRDPPDPERMALEMNREAIPEIVRQLKLRDLGGLVIIDFIDMRHERNCRTIDRLFYEELKRDRAKTKALRMSQFGLVQLTRQRMRPSHQKSISNVCPVCGGKGHIKSTESVSLDVMRLVQLAVHHSNVSRVQVKVPAAVCDTIQNRRRRDLLTMEDATGKRIEFIVGNDLKPDEYQIRCLDDRLIEVDLQLITRAAKDLERDHQERSSRRRRHRSRRDRDRDRDRNRNGFEQRSAPHTLAERVDEDADDFDDEPNGQDAGEDKAIDDRNDERVDNVTDVDRIDGEADPG